MKAIILTGNKLSCVEIDQPKIQGPTDVKLRVLEVGICGTDRELVRCGCSHYPSDKKQLVIGHEMLGSVVEIGKDVRGLNVGDLAVVTVRRGCGQCRSCLSDRQDMCSSDQCLERGIKGLDGFQAEYVVDQEHYIVKVPHSLASIAVLTEPMSVVEKAIEEVVSFQKIRLPDWTEMASVNDKKALVVGLGPIGLLACFALRLRGFSVFAIDLFSSDSLRAKIVEEIGGVYIDGHAIQYQDIPVKYGQIDLILEAAGNAKVDFDLLRALGSNGAAVFTGVTEAGIKLEVQGGDLMRNLTLHNQLILGSVNASKKHWELAIRALELADKQWGPALKKVITQKSSYKDFKDLIGINNPNEIKRVVRWT